MMASKKYEAGTQRPKQKSGKQLGMMQFVLIGVGIIALIIIALLLGSGGGKKAAAPRTKTAADSVSTSDRARKSAVSESQRAKKEEERAKLREARLQRKQEARENEGRTARSTSGSRTKRTATGGFSSGGETRSASSPSELRAIIDDGSGARAALVGQRRLRAGDDIEGRRILEVSGDGIKVEYKASTYTVRVGQKVY